MDDLISRQAAIDAVNSLTYPSSLMDVKRKLIELPSAEPQERKTGKWMRHYSRPNVYADLYWHCSECGYKNNNDYANVYHHYCPNCGARMEVTE